MTNRKWKFINGIENFLKEFFKAGGTRGLPISEYKTTDWIYRLFYLGTSITNGSFFKFREPISENKIRFTNDFVVDVRRYKNAVVNMYVHLYGKQYLPFSKEKTEFIHYSSKSDTSEYPIIESSIMIKEN